MISLTLLYNCVHCLRPGTIYIRTDTSNYRQMRVNRRLRSVRNSWISIYMFDKFSWLIPYIATMDARNMVSFTAAAASATCNELTSSTNQNPADSSSSRGPTPPILPTASQPRSVSSRRGSERKMISGEMSKYYCPLIILAYRFTSH